MFLNFRFDEKSLRKLDSDLESLRHYDFRFKLDKNYKNTLPKYNNQLLTTDLAFGDELQIKNQQVKLPTIVELQQNNFKPLAQLSMSSPAINIGTPKNSSMEGNLSKHVCNSNTLNKSCKLSNRPIDIDTFIRKKNLQILNKPWNINKSLMVSKSAEKLSSVNPEATQFLINKLKNFLRDKYEIDADNDMVNSYNSFNSLNTMKISKQATPGTTTVNDLMSNSMNMSSNIFPSNIKSSKSELVSFAEPSRIRSSQLSIYKTTKEGATDLYGNSIYIKKFKNNYYDRKLWYTLLNNSSINDTITARATTANVKNFNFYADNSVRDYNNEFDILNKFDSSETQKRSIFSRS
jgi:hypothetical protein